jgi:hypothetical protein
MMITTTTLFGQAAGENPSVPALGRPGWRRMLGRLGGGLVLIGSLLAPQASAQETVCARVKIQIKQEMTLERQAFDAEMKIANTLDTTSLEEIGVVVKVTDEAGVPVAITNDSNNLSARFYVRVSGMENISDVAGNGTVPPATTSTINWLIIPAPGAAGDSPLGKKYLIGATLTYKFGGETHTLEVTPDVITVKPMPLLTLDYFLTQDVVADDPMTDEIEPSEPFTLGVRVKNTGMAVAKNLKIDSAQPKIIENNQGLLINFQLTGSYVDDAPVQNTLLINFGDILPNTSKMGRWIMETTLAGRFTEFSATFSHADELGGMLTSLLQATNAHFLIRDVRVDLNGRDLVRDFLALDGTVIRVYESDGLDSEVADLSGVAQLTAGTGPSGNAGYRLVIPATQGFIYVKLPDPYHGQKALGRILRSDGKEMLPENVWLSKTKNPQTKQWDYWVSFFDANTPGIYDTEFQAPPAAARAPVLQFIPDRVVKEGEQVSFLVEASSPDGKAVALSAAPLPSGAIFTPQAANPQSPNLARAVFDWTPAAGSAGSYLIVYTASDGALSATRSAAIKVESATPPPGPGTPTIVSPLSGAQVTTLKPTLSVQTSATQNDPTTKVQFEIYADEAMTQIVGSAVVDKVAGADGAAVPTTWQVATALIDNTHYWWRVRAFDGNLLYSAWVNGRFFVNLYNDPPDHFNLTSPAPDAEVAEVMPVLAWTNSIDRDGDVVTYRVDVYRDAALTDRVTGAAGLPGDASGTTHWTVDVPLTNHEKYYWQVIAQDPLGASTPSLVRAFVVNTGNTPPTEPIIVSPPPGGQSPFSNTPLVIRNSTDAENDLITYVFEIDTVNTFDSGDKKASGQIIQSAGDTTSWVAINLIENKRYYWRVKAQDGRAESAWVVSNFLVNAVNDPPPTPTVKNPGNGAWSAVQQPSFEANPVIDPEGEAVRYEFEIYRDAALTNKLTGGISDTTAWIVATPLADKTTYWWRLRAVDAQGAASPWGPANILYISTAPYQDPSIQMMTPATPIVPETVTENGIVRKQVTLRWEGSDPNIEPTVTLYYDTSNSGYAGTAIADGRRQAAGTQSGSHIWDVTDLAPGTYYVYAVIYDAKGVGRAYAPGAVVIPPTPQTGQIVVTVLGRPSTAKPGSMFDFTIRLAQAPKADVVVPLSSTQPLEGAVSPPSLTFTLQNWASAQTVTVTGQSGCSPIRSPKYQILSGKAVSLDPDYIGLSGTPVDVSNQDGIGFMGTTDNSQIHICGFTVLSEQQINATTWEYVIKGILTNTGPAVGAVVANLTKMPTGVQAVDGEMRFGAAATGETVNSADTVTLRSNVKIPDVTFQLGLAFNWTVAVQP